MPSLDSLLRREKPWNDRSLFLIDRLGFESPRLQKVAWRYAKWEHKAQHHDVARPVFNLYKGFLSYVVGGGMEDRVASQIAALTGIDKKKAQRVNAYIALGEQTAIVLGGYAGLNSFDDHGKDSLWVTAPMAGVNAAWSAYRLTDKREKALPGIGYFSAIAHGITYLNRSVRDGLMIGPALKREASLRAKRDGCTPAYAGASILLEGARDTWREASGYTRTAAASLVAMPWLRDLWKR